MDESAVLARLLPDETQAVHVVEATRAGLLLSNGGVLCWAEDDLGAVFVTDFEGDFVGESWPEDEGYSEVIQLLNSHRGPREIRDRPRLRVFWGDEEVQ